MTETGGRDGLQSGLRSAREGALFPAAGAGRRKRAAEALSKRRARTRSCRWRWAREGEGEGEMKASQAAGEARLWAKAE